MTNRNLRPTEIDRSRRQSEQSQTSSTTVTVSELARREKIGRTRIYEEIARGALRAKKRGRNTIITDEDWRDYLARLPCAVSSGAVRAARQSQVA